ncbi:cytidine deaminase-like protein [Exophiala viscosa]|uniref:Cytidine deaminase-like protein n=1 Tax=Exophiala viscosa TaxID=2486360 RepID=A0AAN6DZ86_9EURO|nr:cytidine deaminase-like protein [Exophiala viscosa]KAI1624117.1 cytidine deaminase-like protein [Exophiala viscosa]
MTTLLVVLLCLCASLFPTLSTAKQSPVHPVGSGAEIDLENDPVSADIRAHWMRRAISTLSDLQSTCPFAPFGAVIVNHTVTEPGEGELVCIGVNAVQMDGNPTLHGEVAAINNCTSILTDPAGKYQLSGPDALKAFSDLSLYTTAEACPMCSSAILYGAFREYIYSTPIHGPNSLLAHGWPQIDLPSKEIFARSLGREVRTRIVPQVLANETEGLFVWQFGDGACPASCVKEQDERGWCVEGEKQEVPTGKKASPGREL